MRMDMKHGHAAKTRSMDIQHGHEGVDMYGKPAWNCMDLQHTYVAWTHSTDLQMECIMYIQQGHAA
jgi:hypothetical protein